jgi:tetratricopeptide (TPR) repeat protein
MFAFLNKSPQNSTLISAIRQLDKIATDVEDKKFEALDLEEKIVKNPSQIKQQSIYPSYNYVLAIHHCRIGYLFAENKNWNEAVKHFTKGLDIFETIDNKNEIERAQIVFFSTVFYMRGLYLLKSLNNREQAIVSFNAALELIQGIKQEARTIEDAAYQIFYYMQKLLAELNLDISNVQINSVRNIDLYADRLSKFFDIGVANRSLPRIKKFECDRSVEEGDEANKARDLFRSVSASLPELIKPSLQSNSLFNNASSSSLKVRNVEQKKSEFKYSMTCRT